MTIVALGSVKGAPGVSTAALALAASWPGTRRVVVAEADPDGGVLAARRNLRPEPGLVTLAAAIRRGGASLSGHTQEMGAGVDALVAPAAADQVRAALSVAGDRLAQAFAQRDDVLIDCGRVRPASALAPLLHRADATLLLLRPRLDEVMVVRHQVAALRNTGVDPALVVVRDGPYRQDEIAAAVGAQVLGELPVDQRTALALGDRSDRTLSARSPLLRSARQLATVLAAGPRHSGVGHR